MWQLLVQRVFSHLCSLFKLLFCVTWHYPVNFFISTVAYPGLIPTCQLPNNKEIFSYSNGSPLVTVQRCVVGATETLLGAMLWERGRDCCEKMSLILYLPDFILIHISLHNARCIKERQQDRSSLLSVELFRHRVKSSQILLSSVVNSGSWCTHQGWIFPSGSSLFRPGLFRSLGRHWIFNLGELMYRTLIT